VQIDDRTAEAGWILSRDLLYGIGDRAEVIGRKCRRDQHDPRVFDSQALLP
jgi:hypothetical protein